MGKLTEPMLATLREMKSYSDKGKPYWFRYATCLKLKTLNLAEDFLFPSMRERKRNPHRITTAGRRALKEEK